MRLRHVPLLAVLLVPTPALSAPPKLVLPPEVRGDVGAFVPIPAVTDGKTVTWKVIDPGLNMFPAELLKDTKTAVVSSAVAGRYRVIAVTAAGDEVSQFAETLVVIGNAAKPPPTDPPPQPPAALYFLVVRPDGPAAPAFTRAMSLPEWRALEAAGHKVKDKTATEARKLGVVVPPVVAAPYVVVLRVSADGLSSAVLRDSVPLPATGADVLKLPDLVPVPSGDARQEKR